MKWCEKCKDYAVCALTDKKPKCFTDRKTEPSNCDTCKHNKLEWYSEVCDSCCGNNNHYEPKDEPQTEKGGCTNCDGKDLCNNAFTEISQYCGAYEPQNGYQTFNGTSVYVSRLEDEPQTYKPTCNGECRNCEYRAKDGNYCMKTDCSWK